MSSRKPSGAPDTPASPANAVLLRGRLAQPVLERELPSGDVLATFRLIVDRPPGDRVKVDTIDCVAERSTVRRLLGRTQPGEVLEVEGALRRRFWRGAGGGPTSRYEVRVEKARGFTAGRRSAASRDRTQVSV